MRAAPWVYRRWESQVDRGTYFFYEDNRGGKTYMKGPRFNYSTTWTFLTRLMAVAFLGRIDIQSMARTQPVGLV